MTFESRVREYCTLHSLLPAAPDAVVAVALSGGADSVALLGVLLGMGVRVRAYHCNFHLRGAESDRDEAFCFSLCAQLGVGISVMHFDVKARMAATGESVEMACRELRYGWWRSLGLDTLAVAHHSDDNVETLMLNLMRGSGVTGLKGMLPQRDNIIRPLLCVTRHDILDYLQARGLDYVTDSTNLQSDFRRNRLRNLLLPELERLFPGALDGIRRSILALQGDYSLIASVAADCRDKYFESDGSIDIEAIAVNEAAPAQVLYRLMAPQGLDIAQCRSILAPADTSSGRIYKGTACDWITDRGHLRAIKHEETTAQEIKLSEPPFELQIMSKEEFDAVTKRRDTLYVDASLLESPEPFIQRPWRQGDRLEPFGMKGSRLVSDIFSDLHIGPARRSHYPLLLHGDKVLWVCGLRASRHYPVTSSTTRVAAVRYSETPAH